MNKQEIEKMARGIRDMADAIIEMCYTHLLPPPAQRFMPHQCQAIEDSQPAAPKARELLITGTIKRETEKALMIVRADGMIKWLPRQFVESHDIHGALLKDRGKWLLDKKWEEDKY